MANKQRGIGISLGKKDADLKTWFKKLKLLHLEQSFYIQKALNASLENKKIFLGSIVPDLSIPNFNTSYTIPKSDIKIMKYMEDLNQKNIKSATFIKEIIRKSIKIIRTTEEEYIPNYIDMYSYSNDLTTEPIKNRIEKNIPINKTELNVRSHEKDIKKDDIGKLNKMKNDKKKVNPLINFVK